MRNLKRALSLAVASVMLLGLMIVGTGAVSVDDFNDADQINNVEAATITTGLGLFAGADGNFLPAEPVTRAQMATIICKMLYGNDVNADNFKGAGTFEDTANYQSGWAEGYINMCASLGIVSGYNETTYGPGDTVTTWQAALMLQRALGYWNTAASEPINELTVTALATQLGFFGDLTLSANEPLAREDVAVMAFNALFAQRVAYDDYRGLYVKANDRNVVVTNGTDDPSNTLAQNTFGLYSVEGVVTANGYTDERLSETLIAEPQTRVMFTEATDLDQDGRFEYSAGEDYDFEVGTDLNMIGHAATVYYTIERKAPVVYAIVDDATLVSVIDYDDNTTVLANNANDAGFRRNTILDVAEADYIVNYDFDTTVADLEADNARWQDNTPVALTNGRIDLDTNNDGVDDMAKKLIVISNSGNYDVDYVIVLDQYLDTISMVDEDRDGTVTYELRDTEDGADMNAVTEALDEDDFVIVTNIGNQGDVKVLQPATLVGANITKITGVSNTNADVTRVTADGEYYYESSVASRVAENFTAFVSIDTIGEATLVLDQFGDLIGLAEEASLPNYAYVAQYGVRHSTSSLNTEDALTAHVYFADGTDGVYVVHSFEDENSNTGRLAGFADTDTTELSGDEVDRVKGEGAYAADGGMNADTGRNSRTGALGIWNVTLRSDGMVDISAAKTTEETAQGTDGAGEDGVRLVKGHSTFVSAAGDAVEGVNNADNGVLGVDRDNVDGAIRNNYLYQNNDTVYFYVNGEYDDNNFSVDVIIGVKNAVGFTNDKNGDDIGIQQVHATAGDTIVDRNTVGAVLVEGVDTGTANVYYYNTGNYHYSADGLVYELYDLEGNLVELTYEDLNESNAANKWDGYYVARANDIEPLAVASAQTPGAGGALEDTDFDGDRNADEQAVSFSGDEYVIAQDGDNYYIINDDAMYSEYIDNLYTRHDIVGTIAENPVIVDACDSGLTTLSRLINAIRDDGSVKISFFYNDDDYVADVIFVSYYNPDKTEAPGEDDTDTDFEGVTLYGNGDVRLEMSADNAVGDKVTVNLYRFTDGDGWTYVESRDITIVAGSWGAAAANREAGYWLSQQTGGSHFALTPNATYKVVVGDLQSPGVLGE